MKILYLHQYFNTPDMAGGTRSYEMARRLVERGHEVHMLTSWRDSSADHSWFETDIEGICVHWLPVQYSNNMSYLSRIFAFFKFAIYAARKAVIIGGDVIFATSTPLTIALPAVYASKKLDKPMVFEVRDLWPELPIAIGALKNPVLKWAALHLEDFAYRNSRKVIALSPGMVDGVLSKKHQSYEDVRMIPNGCDLDKFTFVKGEKSSFRANHPELEGRPIVLYAGTFGLINGVSYAIDLAEKVSNIDASVCFVLVGDGAERDLVQQKAIDCGLLNETIFMYDSLPKRDMPDLFGCADLSLSLFIDLKPMWSNSANKFFDALGSGTPVVINYGGWQKDLLEKEGAGFCIPADDFDLAAALLVDRVRDSRWLKDAGFRARTLAENNFSRDRLADEFESTLVDAVFSTDSP